MVLAKITGGILIIFGIFVGLNHFGLFSYTLFGLDVVIIGILLFIAHEIYALVTNLSSDGNKAVGIGVPLLFTVIAGSYFIKEYIPEPIASNILLITAVLMCAEGLYRLH